MNRLTARPFDLQEVFLRMYSWECLLDLEKEKYVVSHLGRAQLLLFILEYLSTGDELQLFSLGPIYLLPLHHLSLASVLMKDLKGSFSILCLTRICFLI